MFAGEGLSDVYLFSLISLRKLKIIFLICQEGPDPSSILDLRMVKAKLL